LSTNETSKNGKVDIARVFATPGLVDAAMKRGVREALRRHKLLGESIAVWRDGKVVIVPPEEIELPELPDDDA
jgi:hypothetical protein